MLRFLFTTAANTEIVYAPVPNYNRCNNWHSICFGSYLQPPQILTYYMLRFLFPTAANTNIVYMLRFYFQPPQILTYYMLRFLSSTAANTDILYASVPFYNRRKYWHSICFTSCLQPQQILKGYLYSISTLPAQQM